MLNKPVLLIDIDSLFDLNQPNFTDHELLIDIISTIRTSMKRYKAREIVMFCDSFDENIKQDNTKNKNIKKIAEWSRAMGISFWQKNNQRSIDGIHSAIEQYTNESPKQPIYLLSLDPLLMQELNKNKVRLIDIRRFELIDKEEIKNNININIKNISEFFSIIGHPGRKVRPLPTSGPQWVIQGINDKKSHEYKKLKALKKKELELFEKNLEKTTLGFNGNIKFDISKYARKNPDADEIKKIYSELGLESWLTPPELERSNKTLISRKDIINWTHQIEQMGDKESYLWFVYHNNKPIGLSYLVGQNNTFIPFNKTETVSWILNQVSTIFNNQSLITINQQEILQTLSDFELHNFSDSKFDLLNASYTLDSQIQDIKGVFNQFNNSSFKSFYDVLSSEKRKKPLNELNEEINQWVFKNSSQFPLIHQSIKDSFSVQPNVAKYYHDIEKQLPVILQSMQNKGFKISEDELTAIKQSAENDISNIAKDIYLDANKEFNIDSPKQVSNILYDTLNLINPEHKKDTKQSSLLKMQDQHPIINKILNYRRKQTMYTKYILPLSDSYKQESGAIHAHLNQTQTSSGRLSCSNPPLQSIPTDERAKELSIRKTFKSSDNHSLVTFDYSQIEICVLAHLSGDPILIKSFQQNLDIHTSTASEIFNTPIDNVTEQQRKTAKAINFGLIYGMSSFGLAKKLSITKDEAQIYIDKYFKRYKGVEQYLRYIKDMAAKKGYITTLFGRKIHYPEYPTAVGSKKSELERSIMNAPMQGSAAEIIKVAMVEVNKALKNLDQTASWMIMQIHDELLFEIPNNRLKEALPIIKETMEDVGNLSIKLKVKGNYGKSWGELNKDDIDINNINEELLL